MSALQKLKAYFGMVPADELDDYDEDDRYGGGYGSAYQPEDYELRRPDRRAQAPAGQPAPGVQAGPGRGLRGLRGATPHPEAAVGRRTRHAAPPVAAGARCAGHGA